MDRNSRQVRGVVGWFAEGLAWEVASTWAALPLIFVFGIVAWASSWSFKTVALAFLLVALVYGVIMSIVDRTIRKPEV